MTPADLQTIATRIRARAQSDSESVALREKSLGIWQETKWADYGDLVERAASGLLALGTRPGEGVAIQCENRPEWLVADAGAVAARAVTIGLGPTAPAAELEQLLRHSGARVLVAEDQEQVDKALAVKAALPRLRWIVYIEPRGVRDYQEPALVWWPDLLERGNRHRLEDPHALDGLAAEVRDDDPVTLAYATADAPTPATITVRDVNLALATLADGGELHPAPGSSDFVLCHLPLWQLAERMGSGWLNAHAGVQVRFGEPSADPVQTLREVQPSLFLGSQGTWERLRAAVNGGTAPTSRLKRRALRNELGLRKCRSAVSTSPPAPELVDWCVALGIPMREVRVELAGEPA
jgi:long-chain acyl-CoA synthetase